MMALYCSKKKIPPLLRSITLKYNGDYYCLNYLHSFRTKNKLSSHKKECEKKDLCSVAIPSIDTNILEFDQHRISDKHHLLFMQILNL